MFSVSLSSLWVAVLLGNHDAFRVSPPSTSSRAAVMSRWIMSQQDNDMSPKSMMESTMKPMQRGVQSVLALSSALLASTLAQPSRASAAMMNSASMLVAGRMEDVNDKLAAYGLPPLLFVPPGFAPLVSEFGRGNIKNAMVNPILIQFCHPGLWVEATTTINNNGEAGTVSANDYIKGDSAFFFNQPLKSGESLGEGSKDLVKSFLTASLSQKGDPVEVFKLVSFTKGAVGVDGQPYYLADIAYTINTEAGFLIGRKGVVSLTTVGPYLQGLVCVSTDKRYKTLEGSLRDIAGSFRVYKLKSGIFSTADKEE